MTKVKTTAVQQAKIEALEAEGITCYAESIQGKGVVRAFERYLETGESGKISRGLYQFLTMRCGYIAHFSLEGFRGYYREPAQLLGGELYGLRTFGLRGEYRPVTHSEYVYKEGMTSSEVYAGLCEVAGRLARKVFERAESELREREIAAARELASRHGYELREAA